MMEIDSDNLSSSLLKKILSPPDYTAFLIAFYIHKACFIVNRIKKGYEWRNMLEDIHIKQLVECYSKYFISQEINETVKEREESYILRSMLIEKFEKEGKSDGFIKGECYRNFRKRKQKAIKTVTPELLEKMSKNNQPPTQKVREPKEGGEK